MKKAFYLVVLIISASIINAQKPMIIDSVIVIPKTKIESNPIKVTSTVLSKVVIMVVSGDGYIIKGFDFTAVFNGMIYVAKYVGNRVETAIEKALSEKATSIYFENVLMTRGSENRSISFAVKVIY